MQDLDRVLDGDDVHLAGGVDVVDHRGQGRRLARAGRSGDEHETAGLVGEAGEHDRQAQVVHRRRRAAHPPEDHGHAAALAEGVHAEAADAVDHVGEVGLVVALEVVGRVGAHDGGGHLRNRRRRESLDLEAAEVPVHPDAGDGVPLDVQV